MSFLKSPAFKYLKNLIIGVGAALVMLGALYKIQSWEMPVIFGQKVDLLTLGLLTETLIFLLLGLIGPEKDYYWEKLYPGIDKYNSQVAALSAGAGPSADFGNMKPINGEVVENQLGGMLAELQGMSQSLGSLKALQEVDFSQTGDQIRTMNSFYTKMNEAMASLSDSVEDTKMYKEQMSSLNRNLTSLNSVYGNVLNAFQAKA